MKNIINFESVFRHGSVRDAAKELQISPSTVSRSMQKLEEYFGTKLFIVTSVKLIPTMFACQLYESIEGHVSNLEQIYEKSWSEHVSIKILSPTYLTFRDIGTITRNFSVTMNKKLQLTLRNFSTSYEKAEQELRSGHLDILVDIKDSSSFLIESREIYKDKWCFLGSPKYYNNSMQVDRAIKHSGIVVMDWLGNMGQYAKDILGPSFMSRVSLITDNYHDFMVGINSCGLIGIGPKNVADSFGLTTLSIEDDYLFKIHLHYNKNSYRDNEHLKWFIDNKSMTSSISFRQWSELGIIGGSVAKFT